MPPPPSVNLARFLAPYFFFFFARGRTVVPTLLSLVPATQIMEEASPSIQDGTPGSSLGAVFAASKFIAKAHRNRRYAKAKEQNMMYLARR